MKPDKNYTKSNRRVQNTFYLKEQLPNFKKLTRLLLRRGVFDRFYGNERRQRVYDKRP